MAGPDPRRSSRARTTQPQSRPSSTTSSVSGRADRHPKPFAKTGSPQKSISTASLASEPPEDATASADETPQPPTRSRRAANPNVIKDDQDRSSIVISGIDMLNDGDEIQEDDEAVRCICGYEDYPGPPSSDDLKQAAKDGFDVDTVFPTVVTDDLAGFFVQCDICKVWQHGACVGLVNDNTLPEEYYCEECRKDLHKIFPGTNGPRCSIYLALNRRRSRTGSFVKDRERSPKAKESKDSSKDAGKDTSKDGSKDARSSRAASSSLPSKRRSTMNSRDAAYDEEQLRIAIEASKEDAGSDNAEGASRRPKRSRSDSEEKTDSIKRQRTSSRSLSPAPEKSTPADDSDEAMATRNGSSKKSSRSAAAAVRSQQQREKAEREEKERQRVEAANKRSGRAERRRADGTDMARMLKVVAEAEAHSDTDSDPSEEAPLAARAATRTAATPAVTSAPANPTATATTSATTIAPAASSTGAERTAPARPAQPSPETPPPTTAPAMSASKSKGGRPTHKKKGRNQYTKEREAREEQNGRSRSRDVPENGTGKSGSGGGSGSHNKSRAKGGMSSRITMTEMRRRVAGMSDFISITQLELAGEEGSQAGKSTPGEEPKTKDSTPTGDAASTTNGGKEGGSPAKKSSDNHGTGGPANLDREFKTLSVVEMMDVINRRIAHWQNEFGN